MPTIGQLSQERIGTDLRSIAASFAPGQDVPAQLVAGRDQALLVLRKYVPNFSFDEHAADLQMRDIEAWAERNDAQLSDALSSGKDSLPPSVWLSMGSQRAQSFVLSSFTQAAAGLGPWTSGLVAKYAAERKIINEDWARNDANQRLEMFALILKMERDGSLASVFVAPASDAALGAAPVVPVWVIVVAIVTIAASVIVAVVSWRRIGLNNKTMREFCQRAYDDGNDEVVSHCIEAMRDLQISPLERAAATLTTRVGTVAIGGAAIYAALTFVLPWARKKLAEADWY